MEITLTGAKLKFLTEFVPGYEYHGLVGFY